MSTLTTQSGRPQPREALGPEVSRQRGFFLSPQKLECLLPHKVPEEVGEGIDKMGPLRRLWLEAACLSKARTDHSSLKGQMEQTHCDSPPWVPFRTFKFMSFLPSGTCFPCRVSPSPLP